MKCYQTIVLAILAAAVVIVTGCRQPGVEFWEEYNDVFDANGRVENYTINKGKPFVINSFRYDAFRYVLFHTPEGKIDRIIEENPDWEFVFYCQMAPEDSMRLIKLLSRYHCHFPVIMDPDGVWVHEYLKGDYSAIGVICDKTGNTLGVSVIGTSQSSFDSEFASAKRALSKTK
jgi:hypothetical protein